MLSMQAALDTRLYIYLYMADWIQLGYKQMVRPDVLGV